MGFDWMGRRVLVTGATGFIGSALAAEMLDLGGELTAFIVDDDPQSEFHRSNISRRARVVSGALESRRDLERVMGLAEPEVVFHLGAQTLVGTAMRYPESTFETNVRGSYLLLEAARALGDGLIAFVVASSDKAYGETIGEASREDHPLRARHPYDASKACADILALTYAHSYGLPVGVARCGNVYGRGDLNFSRIVPGTIRSLLEDEPPIVRSDGKLVRDYFYLADAVSAYRLLAEAVVEGSARGEAFNFSNEEPLSVLEVIERIAQAMGIEDCVADVQATATAEIQRQALSARKAREVLGWRPAYNLASGLRETVAWYRTYLHGNLD